MVNVRMEFDRKELVIIYAVLSFIVQLHEREKSVSELFTKINVNLYDVKKLRKKVKRKKAPKKRKKANKKKTTRKKRK